MSSGFIRHGVLTVGVGGFGVRELRTIVSEFLAGRYGRVGGEFWDVFPRMGAVDTYVGSAADFLREIASRLSDDEMSAISSMLRTVNLWQESVRTLGIRDSKALFRAVVEGAGRFTLVGELLAEKGVEAIKSELVKAEEGQAPPNMTFVFHSSGGGTGGGSGPVVLRTFREEFGYSISHVPFSVTVLPFEGEEKWKYFNPPLCLGRLAHTGCSVMLVDNHSCEMAVIGAERHGRRRIMAAVNIKLAYVVAGLSLAPNFTGAYESEFEMADVYHLLARTGQGAAPLIVPAIGVYDVKALRRLTPYALWLHSIAHGTLAQVGVGRWVECRSYVQRVVVLFLYPEGIDESLVVRVNEEDVRAVYPAEEVAQRHLFVPGIKRVWVLTFFINPFVPRVARFLRDSYLDVERHSRETYAAIPREVGEKAGVTLDYVRERLNAWNSSFVRYYDSELRYGDTINEVGIDGGPCVPLSASWNISY